MMRRKSITGGKIYTGSSIRIRSWIVKLIVIIIVGYCTYAVIRSIKNSIIFLKKDRVNVIFYGEKTVFFSFGLTDGVNYRSQFDNDLAIRVPGGYEYYKIGSLGKLSSLEKKPDLIQKAFSSATSSFIDFYFYPKKISIYTKNRENETFPSVMHMLFSPQYHTNASFFDRILLSVVLVNKRKNDFLRLEVSNASPDEQSSEEQFDNIHQGYFYQKKLREEGKNIKIMYSNYSTAVRLSRIIEGEGIRVVDLSSVPNNHKTCIIQDSTDKNGAFSMTSEHLARLFVCRIEKSIHEDIIFILNDTIENEWQ